MSKGVCLDAAYTLDFWKRIATGAKRTSCHFFKMFERCRPICRKKNNDGELLNGLYIIIFTLDICIIFKNENRFKKWLFSVNEIIPLLLFHGLSIKILKKERIAVYNSYVTKTPVTPGQVPTTLALRPKKIRGRSKNW